MAKSQVRVIRGFNNRQPFPVSPVLPVVNKPLPFAVLAVTAVVNKPSDRISA